MADLNFEKFKEGNSRMLTYYFDKHVKALLLFAFQIVSDEDVSEEMVQDAYIKLWSSRERILSEDHLKAFLYQVTRRNCIDHLRGLPHKFSTLKTDLDEHLNTPDANLLAQLIHVETLQLIYAEVKKLPAIQQQIFELTFLEGLSAEEICTQYHMTPNAVYIARSKALATLRKVCKQSDILILLILLDITENLTT